MTQIDDLMKRMKANPLPTVVLVGNGATAGQTRHDLSKLIDAHTEVVRFNAHADHTADGLGGRTTTWVCGEQMPESVRPPDNVSFIRVVPQGFSNYFHADVIFVRSVDGVEDPSSGVVMADNLIRQGLTVHVIGMDGYSGDRMRYWGEPASDRHNSEQEQRFWYRNRGKVVRLDELL